MEENSPLELNKQQLEIVKKQVIQKRKEANKDIHDKLIEFKRYKRERLEEVGRLVLLRKKLVYSIALLGNKLKKPLMPYGEQYKKKKYVKVRPEGYVEKRGRPKRCDKLEENNSDNSGVGSTPQ